MTTTYNQSRHEQPPFDIRERTFQFAIQIVQLCVELERKLGTCWTLSKQLLRSGTSVGANLEEGQAGQSKADFISKYSIARKEARETIYWLRLLRESGISNQQRIPELTDEAQQLVRILTTIIKNARDS
jgi:four helix bundle protein